MKTDIYYKRIFLLENHNNNSSYKLHKRMALPDVHQRNPWGRNNTTCLCIPIWGMLYCFWSGEGTKVEATESLGGMPIRPLWKILY